MQIWQFFNDVDLCLRITGTRLSILWTPHAELYHFESASRPSDSRQRKAKI